jgi:hypothetical protein
MLMGETSIAMSAAPALLAHAGLRHLGCSMTSPRRCALDCARELAMRSGRRAPPRAAP